MASKKGVVMYYDILEQLEDFTDEQFGKITRAIIKYDKTGEVPEFDDPSLKVVFKFMKPTLDRNKKEYEDICEKRRISGSLGGKQKVANASKCYQNLANLADNDNDKENDNDNDIKKEIVKKEKKTFVPPTLEEVKEYAKEKNYLYLANKFYDYFTTGKWVDSKGQKVKNWKQKFITWATYNSKPMTSGRDYSDKELNSLIQNVNDIEI